jgi:hypothetical protein
MSSSFFVRDGTESSDAPIKRTAVERQVNMQILYLFILLLILSLVSTIGSSVRTVSRIRLTRAHDSGSSRHKTGI